LEFASGKEKLEKKAVLEEISEGGEGGRQRARYFLYSGPKRSGRGSKREVGKKVGLE